MTESVAKDPNEKILEWELSCEPEIALRILSEAVGKPRILWFFPSFLESEWVQGRVNQNKFKIWTKGPRRGGPPSVLEGQLYKREHGSHISARITLTFPFNLFDFKSIYIVPIIFLKLIAFIMIILGTVSQNHENLLIIGFPLFAILLVIFLIGFMSNIGKQEMVELETFAKKLFNNCRVFD